MSDKPPGWYPDPQDPSRNLYWDGRTWQQNGAPSTTSAPAPERKRNGKPVLWFIIGMVLLGWFISQCSTTSSTTSQTGKSATNNAIPQTGKSATDDAAYAASIKQSILNGAAVESTSQACAEGIEWICLIADVKTSTNAVAIVTVQVTENDKQLGEKVARSVYNFAKADHPELRSVQVNNAEGKVLANETFS